MFFLFDFRERITNDIQFNSSNADLINFVWRSKFVATGLPLRKKSNTYVWIGNNWCYLARRLKKSDLYGKNGGIITLYRQRVSVHDCSQWVFHDMIMDVKKEWHIRQKVQKVRKKKSWLSDKNRS